ncbi:Nop-domain-containing protein [Fistulina hepatica ATCC 64428]|uniref:Nucleolar protein 56 n=1 Tax=Fistulina hepatica ATCC 64428 TaxID=1128425 RepID=A0A0D7AIE7_9AGAR|nr:Nop-domain-containing protein [Fistulina hepatica ATCC 64428]
MITHALFESASGYAIFDVKLTDDIGAKSQTFQESIQNLQKFGKIVSLKSFIPFKTAAQALENANDISEGIMNEHLKNVIEMNLSKSSKKAPVVLGVSDVTLAGAIREATGVVCEVDTQSEDIIRGIRLHASKLLKGLQNDDLIKAQLGLGHSYSRAKLKFNVNRIDNMIIQAIALLDQLDKDVNLFSMRVREWYGYHFPELVRLVPDNYQYARAAQFIGNKELLDESKLHDLAALLDDDETTAKNVLDAARGSMGSELSEIDMLNVTMFATRVISLAEYRKSLISYLSEKMNLVAPSLTALLGERIGARLISHAGSLTNLSKYPASTVQILGAEKALFRALKTKGNTPKYGLLYHSSFIGRAGPKYKGRISRFLANKCSIASRIDCYSDNPSSKFGEALRAQVEERLNFFETGAPPSKNADAIRKVLEDLALHEDEDVDEDGDAPIADAAALTTLVPTPKKEKRKRKSNDMDIDEEAQPSKKVKLSKEEKKALKKAAKAAKAEKVAKGEKVTNSKSADESKLSKEEKKALKQLKKEHKHMHKEA